MTMVHGHCARLVSCLFTTRSSKHTSQSALSLFCSFCPELAFGLIESESLSVFFIFSESIDVLKIDAKDKIKFLNSWFVANKLSLSLDKTCYSIYGSTDIEKLKIHVKIDDVEIHQVDCSKYLGIFIDDKLSWQSHTDYVYSKINNFTSIFYKIRDKINFDVAKMIYFAFIHSHLAYGIEIYGNTYTNHLNRLMILNNKLLRILQNAPRETPVVELYANFNTLTLPELHTYQILKFIYNCIYHQNKLPSIFSNYFSQNYMIHRHNTRTREHLHLEHT